MPSMGSSLSFSDRDSIGIVADPPAVEGWEGAAVRPGYVPGITTVILTCNEEVHIARAVACAKAFSREVLVVDSGSTDRTVAVATAMGARVVSNDWVNYARQFKFALEDCGIASEWILRLDADEVIGPDLVQSFIAQLPRLGVDVTGIVLNRRHVFMGRWVKHGGRYPLHLLRLWRNGLGQVEDRWMDEHVVIREGRTIALSGEFSDICERDIAFFVSKHNDYATREAIDVLNRRYGLFACPATPFESGRQAKFKRYVKEKIYERLPFAIAPFGYFVFRYVFQLGFLDGREGLIYHVMQGFWYRFLVDVRVRELEAALRHCTDSGERLDTLRRVTGLKL